MQPIAQLSEASKLCLDNAKQYVSDAGLLYSAKSYGHALALTILCDIELGKAVMYHLCSKGMVTKDILPPTFLPNFIDKKYDDFVCKTWWVGLVLASNIDSLVPSIITFCDYSGRISKDENNHNLSKEAKIQMEKLIEKLKPENKKIFDLLDFACKGFFVKCCDSQNNLHSPSNVKKGLVKERIGKIKERIKNGEPFLLLSFSEVQKNIAKGLLKGAFESIIPIRTDINQLMMPLKSC